MAIDKSAFTALRGFNVGATDLANYRKQESQAAYNLYNFSEQKKTNEYNSMAQFDQYIDTVDQLANKEMLRPKDRQAVQGLADQMMSEIRGNVKSYGGYTKYMRAGGHRHLQEYYEYLLGSDEFKRIQMNNDAWKKIRDAEQKGEPLFKKDLDNAALWSNGQIDDLTYTGVKSKIDLDKIQKKYGPNQVLTPEMILFDQEGYMGTVSNFRREYGINPLDLDKGTRDHLLQQYLLEQPEFEALRAGVLRGKGDIPVFDYGTELQQAIMSSPKTYAGESLKAVFSGDSGEVWKQKFGIDVESPTPDNYDNVVRVGIGDLENTLGQFMFGEDFQGMGRSIKVNLKHPSKFIAYDEKGVRITPSVLNRWFRIDYDTKEDLSPTGMFMVNKATGIDPETGDPVTFLVSNSKTKEHAESLNGLQYETVLAMSMNYDSMWPFADDTLMFEVPINDATMRDISTISGQNKMGTTQRESQLDWQSQMDVQKIETGRVQSAQANIAGAFLNGKVENVAPFLSGFSTYVQSNLKTNDIPESMYYPVMATHLITSNSPEEITQSIQNWNMLKDMPGAEPMLNALQRGNLGLFYSILQTQEGITKSHIEKIKKMTKQLRIADQNE